MRMGPGRPREACDDRAKMGLFVVIYRIKTIICTRYTSLCHMKAFLILCGILYRAQLKSVLFAVTFFAVVGH